MSRSVSTALAVLVAAVALALFIASLAGCGGPPPPSTTTTPPPPGPGATAQLILGGVAADAGVMVPLRDGDRVPLVAGAQGGFHVWLRWGVRDLPPGTVTLERSARRVRDDAVVLRFDGRVDVGAAAGDGWYDAPSPIPMFMCPTPIGISIVDEPIHFQLRVLDDGGAELARQGVTLVPSCPDAQRDFCTRICTG